MFGVGERSERGKIIIEVKKQTIVKERARPYCSSHCCKTKTIPGGLLEPYLYRTDVSEIVSLTKLKTREGRKKPVYLSMADG